MEKGIARAGVDNGLRLGHGPGRFPHVRARDATVVARGRPGGSIAAEGLNPVPQDASQRQIRLDSPRPPVRYQSS
jgi:hypothetical protein